MNVLHTNIVWVKRFNLILRTLPLENKILTESNPQARGILAREAAVAAQERGTSMDVAWKAIASRSVTSES